MPCTLFITIPGGHTCQSILRADGYYFRKFLKLNLFNATENVNEIFWSPVWVVTTTRVILSA